MPTPLSSDVPELSWDEFLRWWRWRQGEHVSLIGPTGSGKTTLAHAILERRRWLAVLATKPRDPTLRKMAKAHGWRIVREWRPRPDETGLVLWPPYTRPGDEAGQREAIGSALRSIFAAGAWTVYVDEARYLAQHLRLRGVLEAMWTQGRSVDLTIVAGTQRPAWVPLEMYDQASHLFLWRDRSRENLKRLAGLGAVDSEATRHLIPRLAPHQVLYIDAVSGELRVTRPPKL